MTSASGCRANTARAFRSANIATAASTLIPLGTSSSTPGASARNPIPSAVIKARRADDVDANINSLFVLMGSSRLA